MVTLTQLEPLFQLAPPLLTAYLRVSPAEASLHTPTPGYLPWLKDQSRPIAENLPSAERALFLQQLDRVEEFLRERTPHERSLVIFAGPSTWEVIRLQTELQSQLHWGRPALAPLIWLASEHKPYGIVAVDHAGARFFHYWMGEMVEYEEKKFAVDVSDWKKKDLGHVTGQGVAKTRGSQRDVFAKRMERQYARLCRETAAQAASFSTWKNLAAVFLVGSDRLTQPIEESFPHSFERPVVVFHRDLARVTPLELMKHLEPQIAAWERAREAELVTAVTANGRGAVAGFDEALAQLQRGKVRTLVVARELDAALHQCVQCGWTDRSADPVCSVCGGQRLTVTLRDVLPELARKYHAEIEVAGNEAAEGLKQADGMAAWLREPRGISARSGR